MIVFIDSNIIISNYSLRFPAFEEFKKYYPEKKIEVFISKISVEEILSNHKSDIKSLSTAYNNKVRELSRATTKQINYLSKEFPDDEHKEYTKYLYDNLKKAGIKILSFPVISHEEVIKYAITKKKPFKNNDSGYKDFLIWVTLKNLFLEKSRQLVFITNDNDFLDNGELHSDLVEDLKESNINPDQVSICRNFNGFNELYLKDIYEIVDTKELFESKDKHDHLFSQLESHLENELSSFDLTNSDVKLSHQFENPQIIGLNRFSNFKVILVEDLNKDSVIVEIEVEVEQAHIEFYFDTFLLGNLPSTDYPDEYEVIDDFTAMGNIIRGLLVRAKIITDREIKYISGTEVISIIDK